MFNFTNTRKTVIMGLALMLCIGTMASKSLAQGSPESGGLRFNRLAGKTIETLAKKAGGPTERIEIQTTDDHIDYVVKAYVLKKANANEVYQFIVNAVELESGRVDRFAPGSVVSYENGEAGYEYSGESMLVVTAPEWMIPYLDSTIAALDIEGLEAAAWGDGAVFVRPKHRKPSELAELISGSVASGLEIFMADDSRNILYIEDLPSWFPCDIAGLEAFDVPAYQIDARVRIYEIEESDSVDVGLDWYAWKKAIDGGDLSAEWASPGVPDASHMSLQSVTADLSFNPMLATEFLNYLVGNGSAEVITDTRIALVNGKVGVVDSSVNIPYILREADGDAVVNTVHEYTEGVNVTISPSIGSETMELEIVARVASHLGYTPNHQIPIVTESSVDSTVVLESGKPTVLGGLTRERTVEERSGIPGLKDIPVIKYLFSREIERSKKSQIVITVLPESFEPGAAPDLEPSIAMPSAP